MSSDSRKRISERYIVVCFLTRLAITARRRCSRFTLAISSRSPMHLVAAWMSMSEGITGTMMAEAPRVRSGRSWEG